MVLVPLKKALMFYFAKVCVLLTKAFDVWYDNSSSFYKLAVNSFGFLLVFCWVLPC